MASELLAAMKCMASSFSILRPQRQSKGFTRGAQLGGSDSKTERGQRVSRGRGLKRAEKALHRGASEPCLGYNEIIVLVLRGYEAQSVLPGDRLDRDAPIGSALRDGNAHGVVRFWLRPVASRLGAFEQSIRQNTGAAAGIAVDHQALRHSDRCTYGLLKGPTLKARVALAVHDPLQTSIARHKLQRRREERPIVLSSFRIHQMNGGNVALAAFAGREPAGAADIECLDRYPFGLQPIDQHIEPDAVATDNHEIGKVRPADQLYLDRCAGGYALDMLADRDEPVGLAKSGYSTRALGIGVGGERSFAIGPNQRHHQVFSAASFRSDTHRQCCRQAFGLFRRQPSEGADHRCNKLVEGEDRRGGEAGQDYDR